MKKAITGFFMSWGMFWVVPCPCKRWDEEARGWMLVLLPVLGLGIGALWALAGWLLQKLNFPELLGAALMTVCPLLLTGFIHLDGYMDCCDAILSRRDLETRQKILKDSHTGAFAVISLAVLLLLEFSLFSAVKETESVWLLLFLPAATRSVSAFSVLSFSPMDVSSYSAVIPGLGKGYRWGTALLGLIIAVLPIVLFGLRGLSALCAQLASLLAILYGKRQLGGMNGDISGYGITIGELFGIAAFILL